VHVLGYTPRYTAGVVMIDKLIFYTTLPVFAIRLPAGPLSLPPFGYCRNRTLPPTRSILPLLHAVRR
jgi:hypothetical protein